MYSVLLELGTSGFFFFFFELFYLYCYSFLYLDLIEILGSLGF